MFEELSNGIMLSFHTEMAIYYLDIEFELELGQAHHGYEHWYCNHKRTTKDTIENEHLF